MRPEAAAAAGASGAAAGFLVSNHQGAPVWLVLMAVSGAVLFGMLASYGRAEDLAAARRNAMFNIGALWILACAMTFMFNMALPVATLSGLGIGLLGNRALDQAAHFWLRRSPIATTDHDRSEG